MKNRTKLLWNRWVFGVVTGLGLALGQTAYAVTPIHSKTKTVRLPIQIDEGARANYSEIRLYVRGEDGKWSIAQSGLPSQTVFEYTAPADGTYQFTFVTVDKRGASNPASPAEVPAHRAVIIDTTAPEVGARPFPLRGEKYLQVQVRELYADWNSLKVSYQAPSGEWQPLQRGTTDVHTLFKVPNNSVFESKIKISLSDLAGNSTEREIDLGDPIAMSGIPTTPSLDKGKPDPANFPSDIGSENRLPIRDPNVKLAGNRDPLDSDSPIKTAELKKEIGLGNTKAPGDLDIKIPDVGVKTPSEPKKLNLDPNDLDLRIPDLTAKPKERTPTNPTNLDDRPKPVMPPLPDRNSKDNDLVKIPDFSRVDPPREKPITDPGTPRPLKKEIGLGGNDLELPPIKELTQVGNKEVKAPPGTDQGTTTSKKPATVSDLDAPAPKPATDRTLDPHARKIPLLNTRICTINYKLDGITRAGTKIDFWATPDNGKTWVPLSDEANGSSPAKLKMPSDGIYGIRIRPGAGIKPPESGEEADCYVEIDATKPAVSMLPPVIGSGDDEGTMVLSWNASDKNLLKNSIDLFYSTSSEGPWVVITQGYKNEGMYRWTLPANLPSKLYLRIEAKDYAGNVGRHEVTTTIDAPATKQRVKVINVGPGN